MWGETDFVAWLQRGLDAIARKDPSEMRAVAGQLIQLARTSLADAPWWLLQGRTKEITRIATALNDQGDRETARILLLACSNFFTHTGGHLREEVRHLLAGDADAVFEFVKAAHSPDIDFEAFGMAAATIVRVLRERLARGNGTEKDATFALERVRGRERSGLIALVLEHFPNSPWLWDAAALQFLESGQPREAAHAFERAVQSHDPGGALSDGSRNDAELLARLQAMVLTEGATERVRSRRSAAESGREPRYDLPSLVNLALLTRDLDGAAVARDTVARYAECVSPSVAAMAFLDAGVGEDAIRILVQYLRESPTSREATFVAGDLARAYFALGRTVDAVAALRVLLQERGSLDSALHHLFGSCMSPHRLRHRGRWGGMFPPDTNEDVRQAAIDALVGEMTPTNGEREEATRCLDVLNAGSLEQRKAALAELKRLGAGVSVVVRESLATASAGGARQRPRSEWLLEQWAWEAAENRFRAQTELHGPLPFPTREEEIARAHADTPLDSPQRDWHRLSIHIRDATRLVLDLELEEACRLVDRICDECAPRDKASDPVVIASLAELLVLEGEVGRARRVVHATVADPCAIPRLRELLGLDSEARFNDFVSEACDQQGFERFDLNADEVVRFAADRLDSGSLPLEATLRILHQLGVTEAAHLIRPALRRFPKSPTLLFLYGSLLLCSNRPLSALRVFERCASLKREVGVRQGEKHDAPVDDPDKRPDVHSATIRLLAGYPPRIREAEPSDSTTEPAQRYALAEANGWLPVLANIVILTYEWHGLEPALAKIDHYSETEPVLVKAASLQAIGESDAACALLEREVCRLGRGRGGDALNGLIAAYAAADRLRDAIAVAGLVFQSPVAAREHIDIFFLATMTLLDDDPPDEVIAYERRFIVDAAVDAAIADLVRSHAAGREPDQRVKTLVENVGNEDFDLRSKALDTLRTLGPSVSPEVAETIPHLNESAQKELRVLLEAWAWQAEAARNQARLGLA